MNCVLLSHRNNRINIAQKAQKLLSRLLYADTGKCVIRNVPSSLLTRHMNEELKASVHKRLQIGRCQKPRLEFQTGTNLHDTGSYKFLILSL
ncbi:hypothetical protein V6N13_045539 [Hibiscus sabdariffa]|uniref:Uncharacterized protein n=1 Tax=Hibiscus sabdariffa TaxID=183260 RepID=A0ABR2RM32_9ROSI